MSLTVTRYMRQFYKGNLFGVSQTSRTGYYAGSLASVDQKAIKRALKDLREYDYREGEGGELINKVQAFVKTYNNYMESAGEIDDESFKRYSSKLKKMTKEQKDVLEDIGITMQANGKMKVDKQKLEDCSRYAVSKVFSEDAEFSSSLDQIIKRMQTVFRRNNLVAPKQPPVTKQPSQPQVQEKDDAELIRHLKDILSAGKINYTV